MKNLLLIIIVLLYSCSQKIDHMQIESTLVNGSGEKVTAPLEEQFPKIKNCEFDSLQLQTAQYEGTQFFTENVLRGTGVVTMAPGISFNILNLDNTSFASVSVNTPADDAALKINFPKIVISREIIPYEEFSTFSFDAEDPQAEEDYLIVYINKEKKKISKKHKYHFDSWENYAKSAYIVLTQAVVNATTTEKRYWYEVLQIKGDSMQIKSVPETECDYIENYQDVTKWIRWRNNSCKTVKLNFCY